MCYLFAAYVFSVTAASPRAPLWSAPYRADHTLSEGEAVTLQPPAGVEAGDAYWVEVAGPSILLRRGETPGPDLTLRPRVRGRYRFACLAGELASLVHYKETGTPADRLGKLNTKRKPIQRGRLLTFS